MLNFRPKNFLSGLLFSFLLFSNLCAAAAMIGKGIRSFYGSTVNFVLSPVSEGLQNPDHYKKVAKIFAENGQNALKEGLNKGLTDSKDALREGLSKGLSEGLSEGVKNGSQSVFIGLFLTTASLYLGYKGIKLLEKYLTPKPKFFIPMNKEEKSLRLKDFYGSAEMIQFLENVIDSTLYAQEKNLSMRFNDLILSGPPGVGKTEAAQIIANEIGLPLWFWDVAQYGDDAEGVRKIDEGFKFIQKNPGVFLIDEIDKALQNPKILAKILSYMGSDKKSPFEGLIIFTTNNLEKLNEALMARCIIKDFEHLPPQVVEKLAMKKLNEFRSLECGDEGQDVNKQSLETSSTDKALETSSKDKALETSSTDKALETCSKDKANESIILKLLQHSAIQDKQLTKHATQNPKVIDISKVIFSGRDVSAYIKFLYLGTAGKIGESPEKTKWLDKTFKENIALRDLAVKQGKLLANLAQAKQHC